MSEAQGYLPWAFSDLRPLLTRCRLDKPIQLVKRAFVQEQIDDAGSWQLEIEMPRRHFEEISRVEGLIDPTRCN